MAECQVPVRDRQAHFLGVGRTTIERAEAVVDAAEEEPEEYGRLIEQMDRRGKVAGAYRRLTVLKQAKELDAAGRSADRAVPDHRGRPSVALQERKHIAVPDYGH